MKKLLITLMLISPFSFADWGDVYICEMTTNSNISLDGEKTDYKLEVFTFKLDEAKHAMVFANPDGYFATGTSKLDKYHIVSEEFWMTSSTKSKSLFNKGTFILTAINSTAITNIISNCDKFE